MPTNERQRREAKKTRARTKRAHQIPDGSPSAPKSKRAFSAARGGVYALVGKGSDRILAVAVTVPPGAKSMAELGIGEYLCYRNAPVCSFTVDGTSLLGTDYVQALDRPNTGEVTESARACAYYSS